jgi:uncharacterized protein YbjT (DUF2867 family)
MTSPILLTGGTGTLGRHVTPLLRDAGCTVRILSRHHHEPTDGIEYVTGDLLEGEGIEPAVTGAEVVVHLAGGTKGDDTATQNLVRAASHARVRHIVYISVVGSDTMPLGWFKTQLASEKAVTESGIPWTLLRTAQFHDLVLTMAEKMAKMPVIPVPGGLRFQPVHSREVAGRLVELTLAPPAGRVPDLVGPKVYPMGELLHGYLHARGKRRPMMPVRMPGKAGRAYRAGANLSLEAATSGRRTWEDFLAERLGHGDRSRTTDRAAG